MDDAVKAPLRRLVIDAFPLLIAPQDPYWRAPHVSLYQHPARAELQAAIQRDEGLGRLFTTDDPGLGRSGFIHTSLGRGGSIQDVMFGELVLVAAWDWLTMTERAPGLFNLVQQVDKNIDALRAVAAGGQVPLPARLVFTGFTTERSRSIETPWGVLRAIEPWERELAPPGLAGGVSGADATGNQTTVSYAGEMVLDTTVPYSIVIVLPATPDDRRTTSIVIVDSGPWLILVGSSVIDHCQSPATSTTAILAAA